jgi:tetratricopeptide (TPR) repeat protein
MAKKISRKKLLKEPDEFITFTGKIIRQIIAYQKQIFIVIGVVVAMFLILSLTRYITNRAENTAFALLNQANNQYQALLQNSGPALALKEVQQDFEYILDNYSRYQGAKIARVYYANYCYEAGEYSKASELYTKALDHFKKDPVYRNLILSGLGYSYIGIEDYEKAAQYFEMILSSDIALLKDEAIFNLAKSYEALGKTNKRDEMFQTLVLEYPDSIYSMLVKQ